VIKITYQPLYATVSDNQGYRRTTSSLRGRVNSVNCWVNSYFGTVLNASVQYIECPMPKMSRKGLTPKRYSEKVKAIKEEVNSQHKVRVHIDLEANDRFEYVINGVPIPLKRIQQLRDLEHQRFELQLECLKIFRDSGKKIQAMQLAKTIIER
jgi:hypothetical protein